MELNKTNGEWICKYCEKLFTNRTCYWKHMNTKKTSCLPKEKVEEIFKQNISSKTRINYLNAKTKAQEKQIEKLEMTIQKLADQKILSADQLEDFKQSLLKDMKEEIEEATTQNQFFSAQNQLVINNNNVMNIDSGNYFDFSLAQKGHERLDHISMDLLMKILNHKNFNDTMKNLIAAVFFHPKAPENMSWCVTDKTAKFGALEYNHETGSLLRRLTSSVISKNVQNVMFRVVDLLEELRLNRSFNDQQAKNYNRILNLIGNELNQQCIAEIRETAYEHRNFPKVLWRYLNVMIDQTEVALQEHLQHHESLDF